MTKENNNVPVGYADNIKKEVALHAPNILHKFEKGDYCGFEIKDTTESVKFYNLSKENIGYRIFNVGGLPLTEFSREACRRGICDSFENAKYFIDQILYFDNYIDECLRVMYIEKEKSDKKLIVSALLKNE